MIQRPQRSCAGLFAAALLALPGLLFAGLSSAKTPNDLEAIQRELTELGRQRDAWLASQQKATEPDVSDALTSALRDQASRKNFVFVE